MLAFIFEGPSSAERRLGKLIPVQSTAKARRTYKHRGRVVARLGRPNKDQKKRKQMIVGEEDEAVWFSLPNQKKKRKKQVHSLKHSVMANRAGAKQ